MKLADRLSNLFRVSRRTQDPAPANDALPWVGRSNKVNRPPEPPAATRRTNKRLVSAGARASA
jgi:hypothetical protein